MTMRFNVESLRQNGFKVKVRHYRRNLEKFMGGQRVVIDRTCQDSLPTGGYTEVEVITPDGQVLNGFANCSVYDNYNKRIGVQIALGRALNG